MVVIVLVILVVVGAGLSVYYTLRHQGGSNKPTYKSIEERYGVNKE